MPPSPTSSNFTLHPLALALYAGATAAAHAQATPPVATLQEIRVEGALAPDPRVENVSSPKATTRRLDTPQTVDVIPAEVFGQQGARNLTDVLRNTPGISFEAGENGFATSTNNFSLRGFDASNSIFVDGVRDSGNYARDVFNLEQVEVVKGAGADNGRGGPGGYVNLVTKQPRLENFVSGSTSIGFDQYDSDARKRASADVNRVLGGSTAIRLNAMVENSGVAGRSEAKARNWGVAPSIAFGLNSPTTVVLSYQHNRQDDRPDWGVPGATRSGLITSHPSAQHAGRDLFYGLASDYDDVRADALMARIEHRLTPHSTISNQLRWSRNQRDARYTLPTGYDPVTGMVPTQTQFYDRDLTTLSNHTNFTSRLQTGSLRHTLSAGVELTREESKANRYGTINAGNVPVGAPDPHRSVNTDLDPTQASKVRVNTVAAYIYDTIELSPAWQVTGGVRAERYKVRINTADLVSGAPATLDGYEHSDTSLNGKLGLVFKPSANGSIYASFGISSLPPGSYLSNPDISRTGDNAFPGFVQDADPQRSYHYEIGTKWELLEHRLTATAAAFRTERRKVGMTTGHDSELIGYGKQIVNGVELGLSGRITNAWTVYAGATFLDSERRHSAEIDSQLRHGPANGDQLAFTPRVTANLWSTYRLQQGVTVGGGLRHVGSSYVGRPDNANRIIPNNQAGKQPSYTVVDLMAAYELNRNLTLRFNVDNVFDKTYVVSSNWNAQRVFLGSPRTYLLSADLRF